MPNTPSSSNVKSPDNHTKIAIEDYIKPIGNLASRFEILHDEDGKPVEVDERNFKQILPFIKDAYKGREAKVEGVFEYFRNCELSEDKSNLGLYNEVILKILSNFNKRVDFNVDSGMTDLYEEMLNMKSDEDAGEILIHLFAYHIHVLDHGDNEIKERLYNELLKLKEALEKKQIELNKKINDFNDLYKKLGETDDDKEVEKIKNQLLKLKEDILKTFKEYEKLFLEFVEAVKEYNKHSKLPPIKVDEAAFNKYKEQLEKKLGSDFEEELNTYIDRLKEFKEFDEIQKEYNTLREKINKDIEEINGDVSNLNNDIKDWKKKCRLDRLKELNKSDFKNPNYPPTKENILKNKEKLKETEEYIDILEKLVLDDDTLNLFNDKSFEIEGKIDDTKTRVLDLEKILDKLLKSNYLGDKYKDIEEVQKAIECLGKIRKELEEEKKKLDDVREIVNKFVGELIVKAGKTNGLEKDAIIKKLKVYKNFLINLIKSQEAIVDEYVSLKNDLDEAKKRMNNLEGNKQSEEYLKAKKAHKNALKAFREIEFKYKSSPPMNLRNGVFQLKKETWGNEGPEIFTSVDKEDAGYVSIRGNYGTSLENDISVFESFIASTDLDLGMEKDKDEDKRENGKRIKAKGRKDKRYFDKETKIRAANKLKELFIKEVKFDNGNFEVICKDVDEMSDEEKELAAKLGLIKFDLYKSRALFMSMLVKRLKDNLPPLLKSIIHQKCAEIVNKSSVEDCSKNVLAYLRELLEDKVYILKKKKETESESEKSEKYVLEDDERRGLKAMIELFEDDDVNNENHAIVEYDHGAKTKALLLKAIIFYSYLGVNNIDNFEFDFPELDIHLEPGKKIDIKGPKPPAQLDELDIKLPDIPKPKYKKESFWKVHLSQKRHNEKETGIDDLEIVDDGTISDISELINKAANKVVDHGLADYKANNMSRIERFISVLKGDRAVRRDMFNEVRDEEGERVYDDLEGDYHAHRQTIDNREAIGGLEETIKSERLNHLFEQYFSGHLNDEEFRTNAKIITNELILENQDLVIEENANDLLFLAKECKYEFEVWKSVADILSTSSNYDLFMNRLKVIKDNLKGDFDIKSNHFVLDIIDNGISEEDFNKIKKENNFVLRDNLMPEFDIGIRASVRGARPAFQTDYEQKDSLLAKADRKLNYNGLTRGLKMAGFVSLTGVAAVTNPLLGATVGTSLAALFAGTVKSGNITDQARMLDEDFATGERNIKYLKDIVDAGPPPKKWGVFKTKERRAYDQICYEYQIASMTQAMNMIDSISHQILVFNKKRKELSDGERRQQLNNIYILLASLKLTQKYKVNFLSTESGQRRVEEVYAKMFKTIKVALKHLDMKEEDLLKTDEYKGMYSLGEMEFLERKSEYDSFKMKKTAKNAAIAGGVYLSVLGASQYFLAGTTTQTVSNTTTNVKNSLTPDLVQELSSQNIDISNPSTAVENVKQFVDGNADYTYTMLPDGSLDVFNISQFLDVDPAIADDLRKVLGDEKLTQFISDLKSGNTSNTLWETLVKDIYQNKALGNDAKNAVLDFMWKATTDGGLPEMMQIADVNGFDYSASTLKHAVSHLEYNPNLSQWTHNSELAMQTTKDFICAVKTNAATSEIQAKFMELAPRVQQEVLFDFIAEGGKGTDSANALSSAFLDLHTTSTPVGNFGTATSTIVNEVTVPDEAVDLALPAAHASNLSQIKKKKSKVKKPGAFKRFFNWLFA